MRIATVWFDSGARIEVSDYTSIVFTKTHVVFYKGGEFIVAYLAKNVNSITQRKE
jgi:hypothetical protein